jgi:pimeloyl-ACP methyl ester carboxylesterase
MRKTFPARLGAVAALCCLVAAACSSTDADDRADRPSDGSTSTVATTTAPSGPGSTPAAPVEVPCGYAPAGLVEGEDLRCLEVAVPARASDGTFQLRVTVLGPEDPAQDDPLLHLPGGPGASAESYAPILGAVYLPVAAALGRQVVFIDQRGTGASKPYLDCEDATSCRSFLEREGLDAAAFATVHAADDVAAVADALGAEQVNLWGPSYGSRLTLEVVRRHPALVRSAVIEAVDAADFPLRTLAGVRAALETIAERCAADPACAADVPDLRAAVDRAATELAASPLATSFGPVDGEVFTSTLLSVMEQSLGTSRVPLLVRAAVERDAATMEAVLAHVAAQPTPGGRLSLGMLQLTNCNDLVPFDPPTVLDSQRPAADDVLGGAIHASLLASYAEGCAAWGITGDGPTEPVRSDVPTLVVAGTDDANTPFTDAEVVAATLSRSTLVAVPGFGHFPAHRGDSPCTAGIVVTFVQDPEATPDTGCLAPATVQSRLTPPTDATYVPVTVPSLGLATEVPEGWLPAGDGVWAGAGFILSLGLQDGPVADAIGAAAAQLGVAAPVPADVDIAGTPWSTATVTVETGSATLEVRIAGTAAGERTLLVAASGPSGDPGIAELLQRVTAAARPA